MPYNFKDPEAASKAGKMSKRGPNKITKTVKELATAENLERVFKKVEQQALSGCIASQKLYLAYVVGQPTQTIEQHNTGEREIVVLRDGNTYPQIRTTSGATADTEQS